MTIVKVKKRLKMTLKDISPKIFHPKSPYPCERDSSTFQIAASRFHEQLDGPNLHNNKYLQVIWCYLTEVNRNKISIKLGLMVFYGMIRKDSILLLFYVSVKAYLIMLGSP